MANTLQILTEDVGELLATLHELFDSASDSIALVNALGWDLPPGVDDLGLNEIDFTDFLNKLQVVLESTEEEFENELLMAGRIADLVSAMNSLIGDINAFAQSLEAVFAGFGDYVDRTQIHKELPRRMLDLLVVNQVSDASPAAASLLHFLNVFEFKYFPADPANFQLEHVRAIVHYGSVGSFLADPAGHLRATYGWGTPEFSALDLLNRIGEVLRGLGVTLQLQAMDPRAESLLTDGPVVDPDAEPVPQMLVTLYERVGEIAGLKLGFAAFGVRPRAEGGADGGIGFLPITRGDVDGSIPFFSFDDTFIDVSATADLLRRVALILRPGEDLTVKTGGDADVAGQIALGLRRGSIQGEPKSLLTFPGGVGFQYRQVHVLAGAEKQGDRPSESFVEVGLLGCRLGFSLEEADDFLKENVSQTKIETPFDLRIGWNSESGIYFHGSSGLIISTPVHVDLGFVELTSLTLGLGIDEEGLSLESSVDANITMGPLRAGVRRVGLTVSVSYEGGNLGLVDLSPGFKAPSGIDLSIDGGGFNGGGFLQFEPDLARYSGMLELEYQERIELRAIGLLTTRLPGGEPGFSLLILITSEFTPIQLGLGFTLSGVGGLLGLNRTVRVERLRTGLRDDTLRSILFPENVIANADRIISDLRQVFPPQSGRFLFGPMARIGWGTPTLITVDLGLLIELPQPVRVFILGVARALLPDQEAKLLQLQVNFLGEIDFERELFSFDASLFDSKLLSFPLSGDMAVRLKWGDSDPNFLLSVGGFHPAYDPPPLGLPVLRRLTVQLLGGDNPRLTLETYFAVTSNTAQVGARLELYAAAGKFNVYGFLSFDALFQFNPFYFIAEVAAMLALRVGSKSLASIQLSLTLEGTTPWKARGTATLKLCWFIKIKVRFNKTFGEQRDTRLDDVPVLPLLRTALGDSGNWTTRLPIGRHQLVSVKEIADAAGQLVAQPFGVLEISQRVVPLGVEIRKFGNQRPADANRFAIEAVRLGAAGDAETVATASVQEQFAPAQFFEMSDAEKLSSKPFERYDAGLRLTDSERLNAAYAAKRDVDYEIFYVDSQRDQRMRSFGRLAPDLASFNAWASRGAVAASPLSFAGTAKSALAPEAVRVAPEPFAVVNVRDMTLADGTAEASSEAGAFDLLRALVRDNPALEEELQVVPTFEVNRP